MAMQDIAGSSSSASGSGVILPTVRMAVGVTVKALDSLPLPLLFIIFVFCLALLQWPFPPSSPLLPTFTPPSTEKERLSPIFEKSNNNNLFDQLQSYSLTSSSATGGQIPSASGGGTSKMLVMPLPRRKGSKPLRDWRLGLGVVEEVEGEMISVEV